MGQEGRQDGATFSSTDSPRFFSLRYYNLAVSDIACTLHIVVLLYQTGMQLNYFLLLGNVQVLSAIQSALDRVNKNAVSNAQKVQKFFIAKRDFSTAGGELGPTLKLKRNVVLDMYREEIDALYQIEGKN